jgi:hypothetical protein
MFKGVQLGSEEVGTPICVSWNTFSKKGLNPQLGHKDRDWFLLIHLTRINQNEKLLEMNGISQ